MCCQEDQAQQRKRSYHRSSSENVVEYCKGLVNVEFFGEELPQLLSPKRNVRRLSIFDTKDCDAETIDKGKKAHPTTMGCLLKRLHSLIKSETWNYITEVKEVKKLLSCIAELRMRADESTNVCYKRLCKNWDSFVDIVDRVKDTEVNSTVKESYWGSRQQLRAGKIIADHLGSLMDPIFGVLLCPSAGQLDNTELQRQMASDTFHYSDWVDNINLPNFYHNAAFDAFDYLYVYHNIGPGKYYLDPYALFHSSSCNGEELCFVFWGRLFDRLIEEEAPVAVIKL